MEVLALVRQLSHFDLKGVLLADFLRDFVLSDSDLIHRDFIPLLEVNDELVLAPDCFFIFFDLVFVELDLLLLLGANVEQEVGKAAQFDLDAGNLVVLEHLQLLELFDLLAHVLFFLFVVALHLNERADVVTSSLGL